MSPGSPRRDAEDGTRDACAPQIQSCRAVSERAAKLFEWRKLPKWNPAYDSLFSIALDHLTLGRAALYAAILESPISDLRTTISETDAAVTGLRHSGTQHHLPRGLLTRAWCSFAEAGEHTLHGREAQAAQGVARAQSDLEEAWEIAGRGPMPLFLAHIHLHRARLFHAVKPYPWESPQADLAAARRLIEKHGYLRRLPELQDAEAAIR